MVTPLSKFERYEKQFDSFIIHTLRNEARSYEKEQKRQLDHEISITDIELSQIKQEDRYFSKEHEIAALDYVIDFENALLIEALKSLKPRQREIILLAYGLELTDQRISEMLNIVRRTVQYTRAKALEKLKRYMEENDNNE